VKSSTAHYPKQHMFVKKNKIRRRRHPCTREVENPLTSVSHFHYRNDTEQANEPVDPTSEQNRMGPPGQYLTSLYSSGSVRPVSLKPGISFSLTCHMNKRMQMLTTVAIMIELSGRGAGG